MFPAWCFRFVAILSVLAGCSGLFAQISDVEPPKLVSLQFTPNAVDVRNSDQNVTVTAVITDNLSGVNYWAYITVYSPDRSYYLDGYLNRISGDSLAGSYVGTVTFKRGIHPGPWLIDGVYAWDAAGNQMRLSGAALNAIQPSRTVTVQSNVDTTKPVITGLRITPRTIDVSSSDQTLTIEFDWVDDFVGLTPGGNYTFSPVLRSPTGSQRQYGGGNLWKVVSAAPPGTNGATWQMQLVVPRSSEPGPWVIERIDQYDPLNRRWNWSTSQLLASGLDPAFNVLSATPDLIKPTISDITVSPGFVNTTLASQEITLRLKVADQGSGVIFAPTTASISWIYGPYYCSPSQQQCQHTSPWGGPQAYRIVSGTTLNGTWEGKFTLPRYAEAGTWKIRGLELRDRVYNGLYLSQTQLEAAGLQRTIVVTQPTGTPDNTINPTLGGTVIDDVFGSRAQITAPPGVLSTQTTVSLDVFNTPLNVPTPAGFSAPGTHFVNLQLVPHPDKPLPAPGLSVTLPVPGVLTPGTVLTLYRIDTATGTLVAARSVTGGPVTGTVNSGGDSATFHGIAALSTVVALIPSGPVVGDANLDGTVSCLDYLTIRDAFGKRRGQSGYLASADLNNDGVISVNDLMVVARLLTVGCPAQ